MLGDDACFLQEARDASRDMICLVRSLVDCIELVLKLVVEASHRVGQAVPLAGKRGFGCCAEGSSHVE